MTELMVIQGRELHAEDIGLIRSLLAEHGDWCRTRISEELCRRWDWRNGQGRFKDMAARTLLLKLERAGSSNCRSGGVLHPTGPVTAPHPLWLMQPIRSVARCAIYDL